MISYQINFFRSDLKCFVIRGLPKLQRAALRFGLMAVLIVGICSMNAIAQAPPYKSSTKIGSNIITDDDPNTFIKLDAAGQSVRKVFDPRENGSQDTKVYLFTANFDDMDKPIEVRVNTEFDKESARQKAETYLRALGQLPFGLRNEVKNVTLHKTDQNIGGTVRDSGIVIYTESAERYIKGETLPEFLVHEATHAALQSHQKSEGWIKAQKEDGKFITEYAEENPQREDLAESFLMYIAVRYKTDRISAETKQMIEKTIPHRIAYLESLELNMNPIASEDEQETSDAKKSCSDENSLRSINSTEKSEFSITNSTKKTLIGFWLDFQGKRQKKLTIRPNAKINIKTFLTHPWVITDEEGECIQIIYAPEQAVLS
jgi:hypothetical protein